MPAQLLAKEIAASQAPWEHFGQLWRILLPYLLFTSGLPHCAVAPTAFAEEPLRPATRLDPPGLATASTPNITPGFPEQRDGADALVRAIVIANLPPAYENAKHWGQTKARWNGLDVSLDGLQIKTKRRRKEVNHGTWTHYRAWLIDPERELQIHFTPPRRVSGQRVAVDMTVDARLGATGRVSEWNWGLQLYSFHADAEAKVRLIATIELELKLDAKQLPPDILLSPQVTDANLEMHEFRLLRISNADGPLVHKLGDSLRDDIERELNERRPKLMEKINRAIDKNRDKLRFSAYDLVASGWSKLVQPPALSRP